MNKFITLISCFFIVFQSYGQKIKPEIKQYIIDFLIQENQFQFESPDTIRKLVDNKNQGLISITKIKQSKLDNLNIYLFRSGSSYSKVFLLLKKDNEYFVLGKNKIDEEVEAFFNFLKDYKEEDQINFLESLGKKILFVYKNNNSFYQENIMID